MMLEALGACSGSCAFVFAADQHPLHVLCCMYRALNPPAHRVAEAVDPELATTARADVEAKKQAKLIDKLASEWL